MLSIGKLSPGRADYYLSAVAEGAEEYYVGSGEAPGRWIGGSAERLGLHGEVGAHELRSVLAGSDGTGRRLIGNQGPDRMPGFDCTFNAPKSVTLVFALGSPEVRNAVSAAHDAAVDAALAVFEDEAARARRGRGGLAVVNAEGFVAAAFRHRTSRAGDPHLHTHVVVANLAFVASEGRWSALDGRQIYAWCRTVGFLYEAEMRAQLTERLGLAWNEPRRGIGDVAGIGRPAIEHFSQRRQQITDHMADLGTLGPRAAQVATYATRQAKDTSVPYRALREWWVERAEAYGLDGASIAQLCGTVGRESPQIDDLERLFARLDAPDGLTASRPTFDRRDVIRRICDEATAGASTADVIDAADAYLASRHVLVLADASTGAERIHRGDGRSAPIPVESRRYTTPDMVRTERNLIQMAQHRRGAGAGLAAPLHIDAAITARPTLSDEQEVMVRRICSSGDGVEVVPGVAGSGKTYALAAAREAWQASGRTVVGAALAAQAARQLETGSGIPSSTIARLDADLDGPDSGGLGPDHVLVIDEAAMVGTRSLVRLIAHAHQGGAKVVLIGDACQLPEIEAGGAFAGLDRRSDPARLSANRRQHAPWERQALADLRLGHATEALDAYLAHDRIHHHRGADQTSAEMVGAWWSARQDGHEVLMLASRHEVVTDLNRHARSRMAAAGLLHGPEVDLGGRAFQEGDEVLGLKNDYRAHVLNGTRGTVDAIDHDAETIRVTTTDGIAVEVPFDYARQGHLTHGYAMTVHKAQGATVDTALVLADETMTREGIYTAMSRGRTSNHLYLAGDDARVDIAHAPEVIRDPVDALLASMEVSSAQQLAMEGQPRRSVPG